MSSAKQHWASPDAMNATYAYLYNTMDTPLRTQMSHDLWRLVYDFVPVRDRALNWAVGAGVAYTRVHWLDSEREKFATYNERLVHLERNDEGLDEGILQEMITRQQQAVQQLSVAITDYQRMLFAPPKKTVDRHTGMSFEVQTDPFYCSVHAFNNVARAVIVSPPDVLAAIECTRTLEQRYAGPEDLMLAALREGILLLQLKLTDIDDLAPLDNRAQPVTTHFADLLNDAGGMLVYQPSGCHGVGHYVSLVRATPSNGGGGGGGWLIYSTDRVVARGKTAAAALDMYIATSVGIDVTGVDAHQARILAAQNGLVEQRRFIGLLPLSLACLWDDGSERNAGTSILVRTLLRRTLSQWHLRPPVDLHMLRETWLPEPLSPCAIEDLGWFIGFTNDPVPRCRSTGFELTNAASFMDARHCVYRELNRLADAMLGELLEERYSDFLPLLRETCSFLREHTAIGILFTGADEVPTPLPGIDVMSTFSCTLMSNRRWFRLVVLSIVGNVVREQIRADNETLSDATFRVVILFCLLCYHNMVGYGVALPLNVSAAYEKLRTLDMRQDCLPCDSVPATLAEIANDATFDLRTQNRFACYDLTFWLLRAAQTMHSFALSPAVVQAFALDCDECDDNHSDVDNEAVLVRVLRKTLFRLPLAGADFGKVQRILHEQWAYETPELAAHNERGVKDLVTRAFAEQVGLSEADLMQLVDVLAFDKQYTISPAEPRALCEDDVKPRFLERAAQFGFVHIHRRTFGALALEDDHRPVATHNIDRVAMPTVSGQWRTATVRVERQQQLAVVPLQRLQKLDVRHDFDSRTEMLPPPPPQFDWQEVRCKRQRTATVSAPAANAGY